MVCYFVCIVNSNCLFTFGKCIFLGVLAPASSTPSAYKRGTKSSGNIAIVRNCRCCLPLGDYLLHAHERSRQHATCVELRWFALCLRCVAIVCVREFARAFLVCCQSVCFARSRVHSCGLLQKFAQIRSSSPENFNAKIPLPSQFVLDAPIHLAICLERNHIVLLIIIVTIETLKCE